jgi:hypothetical protein
VSWAWGCTFSQLRQELPRPSHPLCRGPLDLWVGVSREELPQSVTRLWGGAGWRRSEVGTQRQHGVQSADCSCSVPHRTDSTQARKQFPQQICNPGRWCHPCPASQERVLKACILTQRLLTCFVCSTNPTPPLLHSPTFIWRGRGAPLDTSMWAGGRSSPVQIPEALLVVLCSAHRTCVLVLQSDPVEA